MRPSDLMKTAIVSTKNIYYREFGIPGHPEHPIGQGHFILEPKIWATIIKMIQEMEKNILAHVNSHTVYGLRESEYSMCTEYEVWQEANKIVKSWEE